MSQPDYGLPGTHKNQVNEKELKLARTLIGSLVGEFEPKRYKDTYRANLEKLIQAKVKGKQIHAVPEPKVEKVVNDRLSGRILQVIDIPQNAIPDSSKLMVRIYPGVMAQVLDGVEGMIRLPGG